MTQSNKEESGTTVTRMELRTVPAARAAVLAPARHQFHRQPGGCGAEHQYDLRTLPAPSIDD